MEITRRLQGFIVGELGKGWKRVIEVDSSEGWKGRRGRDMKEGVPLEGKRGYRKPDLFKRPAEKG